MYIRIRVLASIALSCIAAASLRAEIVPDLPLHKSESLDGQWQIIIDPYESGFYDYRYRQRDQNRNPNPSETFYLDHKPTDPSDRVEYDFDLTRCSGRLEYAAAGSLLLRRHGLVSPKI